jgi:preprotein translocase subunit SecG
VPVLFIVFVVLFVISSAGLVIFVLLHSGKGTGVSEMFGGVMPTTSTGTGIIERNLDRITIGLAVTWTLSLLAMAIFYPNI